MNRIQQKRLCLIGLFILGLSVATALVLYALRQNINVYLTPDQLSQKKIAGDYHFRLGGMVKKNSIIHDNKTLAVHFIVTDFKREITVYYSGILPDLFREGKGMIAEGSLNEKGEFIATQVLAKHDENYMPKTIDAQLKQNNPVTDKTP